MSLQEQQSEIERYARQKGLSIREWFEERETAAKQGRSVFTAMMKRLQHKDADGVIIHKIDRSARNLKDWADVAELADQGIEVHFTREGVDLLSSSGRLSADVQAVVAANYVRNLREETLKGFYGRLKQGISPLPAPTGYLNVGPGKPKAIDPVRGPLIQEAFRQYATGEYNLASLCREMKRRGLETTGGRSLGISAMARILSNPFYYGLIRIRKNGQSFTGAHEPLISKSMFDAVQGVKQGRTPKRVVLRHKYTYSRLIRCATCGRCLIAEVKKNHVYYRCHAETCRGTSHREEHIDVAAMKQIADLELHPDEVPMIDEYVSKMKGMAKSSGEQAQDSLKLKIAAATHRLNRLTDVYIEGHLDAEMFTQRKEALINERLGYESELRFRARWSEAQHARLDKFVELAKTTYLLYENGTPEQKRDLIENVMSNRSAKEKNLMFKLNSELSEIAARPKVLTGSPCSGRSRTFWRKWVNNLCAPLDPAGSPGLAEAR